MSLVVSTLGRPDALRRLIGSLRDELEAGPTIELIVVDQSPEGSCRPVLEETSTTDLAPGLQCVYLRSGRGASTGRNVGLGHARSRLIMFPDDDAWFPGPTLSQSIAHFQRHPEHDGLCTQLQDGHGQLSMLRWAPTGRLVTKGNHHRTSIGSTMVFRTEAARRAVGFDESIGPGAGSWFGSCEDADFLLRVIDGGAVVWYDPEVVMCHRDARRDGGPDAERKSLAYGCGQGWMWRVHRFSLWLIVGLLARRLLGGFVWSLRGRGDIGRAHTAWARGAVGGWFGLRPVDLAAGGGADEPIDAARGPNDGHESSGPTSREFGRSFSWRILTAPLGTLATFFLTTMVVRNLTAADATVVYAVLAALMIGPILGRFGLHQRAVQDVAAMRTRGDRAAAVALARRHVRAALLPPLVSAPVISLVLVTWGALGTIDIVLVTLTTIVLAAESLRLTVSDVLTGLGATGWGAAMAHQVRAAAVTAVVAAHLVVWPGAVDLRRLMIMMSIVVVVLALVGFRKLASLPHDDDVPTAGVVEGLGATLRVGLPFLVVDLVVVVVARGDVWLAAASLPAEVAAFYSTASVLAFQIATPIGLASVALAPIVSGHVAQRWFAELESLVRAIITGASYLILPVFVVLVVAGEDVLALAYGDAYRSAHRYLVVLMLGNLALATLGVSSVILLMADRQRVAMKLSASWFALAAPLVVIAALVGGPTALAAASATTTVGLYLLLSIAVWFTTGIRVLPYADPRRALPAGRRLTLAPTARTQTVEVGR